MRGGDRGGGRGAPTRSGQALVGRRKGDVVEYQAPGGNLKVEIVDIET